MKTVEALCAAYLEADARYKGLCMMNRATDPKERVAQDLEIRTAMRAMLKATPGPWHYRTYDQSVGSVDDANGDAVAQSQPRPNNDSMLGNPERIANARLISAAPELYEALERLVEYVATRHPDVYLVEQLAALAKARGEQ